jgi:hypothetical protein
MKYKIIIIFLIILYSVSCFASHITIDQQKVFSELDKLSSDFESDDIWALYIRKFGNEKIMIRFPKSPILKSLSDQENSYCIQCKDENNIYQLFVQPLDNYQKDIIYTMLQKVQNDSNAEIVNHFTKKESKNILDISYYENNNDKQVRNRIIVTKENVFTLKVEHPKSSTISDEYFMHSFDILNS